MLHYYKEYVNPYLGQLLENLKMDKSFVKGEGCYLYDEEGNEYLDFIAAYGALPFGYNPKEIWEAINAYQCSKEPSFIQPSALNAAGELAKRLIKVAPKGLKYVTFTNSGAETVEVAIKLCRSATGRIGVLSTKNSFHGKTLGALSATGRGYYQSAFGAPLQGFSYIPYGDLDSLAEELEKRPDYYAAFIVEPIQGEGGIVEPPKNYLKGVKEICEKYGVKLIVDEIQTGLGRTGSLFACDEGGITPDVLLLAKALGGGLIPIGACLCKEDVYNEEFAQKHSSTFAGNSLACRVGIKVLDLLTNESDILDNVRRNGAILKSQLEQLKKKYPNIIKAVRGRGFMLGIEFTDSRDAFPGKLMGIMAEQELLTPVISSYLLNVEKVRVAPTLNGNMVIRIEPSLIAAKKECNRAVKAIENMLQVISEGNSAKLLSYLVDADLQYKYDKAIFEDEEKVLPPNGSEGQFAFLIHPLELKNYTDYDDSLTAFSKSELEELISRWNDMVEPFVISNTRVISKNGQRAYGEFIVVPKTAEELVNLPRDVVLEELRKAIKLAKDRGAKIVGLGAYTSVASGGGLFLKDDGVPLTTGNSFTIVSAVEAVTTALTKLGTQPEDSIAAVIGATGSIGSGISILLSESMSELILIGNPNNRESSEKRLFKLAGKIYKHLTNMINEGKKFKNNSIAAKLKEYDNLPHCEAPLKDFVEFTKAIHGKDSPIRITTNIDKALPKSDIVISATSSVGKLVKPNHLKEGSIVCDMSRPRNVSEEVIHLRPDVLVIDGGIIEIPGLPSLGLNLGFDKGLAYACMSETIMLALEKHYQHTSLGSSGITLENILFTRKLARKHGFKLADFRSFDKPIPDEKWECAITARNKKEALIES